MYKIVLNNETPKIKSVEEVRDDKFYGLLTGNRRYLIVQKLGSGCYLFDVKSWAPFSTHLNMKFAIREYLLSGHEIFEFDTAEEILAWSIEKEIK